MKYLPDASGQIIGILFGDSQGRQRMSALQVRSILEHALSNTVDGSDLQSLSSLFRAAAASQCAPDGPRRPISSEERLLEVQQLSAAIPPGTSRADIDRMFTQYDNFNAGGSYYVNPGVKVEVPYDNTGGPWNPANRVNGSIKVTRGTALVD